MPEIWALLDEDTILIITADHGCDPTTPSTDHSREYVPLLVMGDKVKKSYDLKVRESFGDVGATIAEFLGVDFFRLWRKFWQLIER